mmetsp:Transcript_29899/g.55182  ORF Transcript_29899/g.55182 Transcript_29899/m.55182 type:complete len:208 (-) Transcript_29899:5-628(-)
MWWQWRFGMRGGRIGGSTIVARVSPSLLLVMHLSHSWVTRLPCWLSPSSMMVAAPRPPSRSRLGGDAFAGTADRISTFEPVFTPPSSYPTYSSLVSKTFTARTQCGESVGRMIILGENIVPPIQTAAAAGTAINPTIDSTGAIHAATPPILSAYQAASSINPTINAATPPIHSTSTNAASSNIIDTINALHGRGTIMPHGRTDIPQT